MRSTIAHSVRWTSERRHSKLNFVTPQQRHDGEDAALLAQRRTVLEQAKQSNPSRWGTRPIRNCDPAGPVTLNLEKEADMRQAAHGPILPRNWRINPADNIAGALLEAAIDAQLGVRIIGSGTLV